MEENRRLHRRLSRVIAVDFKTKEDPSVRRRFAGNSIQITILLRDFLGLETWLKNTDTGSRLSYQRGGSVPSILPVASRTYERIFRSIIPVEYFLVMERGTRVTMYFDGIVYREWLIPLRITRNKGMTFCTLNDPENEIDELYSALWSVLVSLEVMRKRKKNDCDKLSPFWLYSSSLIRNFFI